MQIWQAIVLAVIQGITEFLPVSSSGHLAVVQNLWHLPAASVVFDVLLHFGTLGAILAVLGNEIKKICQEKNYRLVALIAVGTIPAAVCGFFFQSAIEKSFLSLPAIGYSFLITAAFLFLTKFSRTQKEMKDLTWTDALCVGAAQAAALFPGISRSGMTIGAGLFRKLQPNAAYKFSFLLAVPAILGAMVLQLPAVWSQTQESFLLAGLGMGIAFLTGIVSLKILEKILQKGRFFWFSVYLTALGIIVLLLK